MAGYDAIGEKYLLVKEIPTAVVECSNLHVALAPYIKGARVLDLACGTGYYSTLLLEWGASAVVGIDLSPAMIDAAEKRREALPPNVREALQYRVGDAISLGKVDDEGFDLVVGAWLLNYAGTQAELTPPGSPRNSEATHQQPGRNPHRPPSPEKLRPRLCIATPPSH